MGKLPNVTGKEMVRFLERQQFVLRRVVGSHHVLRKGDVQTVVPVHGNEDLRIGTLRGILRDVRMKPEEFEKLWRN
ncbi:MAG: type II toxin-antitoxin system HicA family toxin [Candidatus Peribacteraceae bacterium]|nr:type II toxin-antitoxin system HicA family toxin [Candidatus Peribacteraceae bacterium]